MRMHELNENVPIFFFTRFVILCADLAVLSSQVYFSRKLGTFTLSLFLDFLIKSPLIFFS